MNKVRITAIRQTVYPEHTCDVKVGQPWISVDGEGNSISIVFEEVLDRAAAYDRGKLIGECEFEPSADKWIITHTGVREAYEGKGIARKLVLKVIEAARAAGVKISPVCSYARKMMAGKEEFKDVM